MGPLLDGVGLVIRDAGTPPYMLGYLDAGTGSLLFQWAIAGLLGFVFALKTSWRRISSWFSRRSGSEDGDA